MSSLAAVAGQEAVIEAGYYYSVCRVKLEAPAVQNKGQTDSHGESQKSSVQALALPQPKKVMWNVGMGRADVTAEWKLELEGCIQALVLFIVLCCSLLGSIRGATKITSRRTNTNLGSPP